MMPLLTQIGDRFAELLRDEIGVIDMARVRRRNASPSYQGEGAPCASHDFCDANMVMLEAFEKVMDHEPRFLNGTDEAGDYSPEGQADLDVMNAAWAYAKAAHLTAKGK